jgi:hypothetical protein
VLLEFVQNALQNSFQVAVGMRFGSSAIPIEKGFVYLAMVIPGRFSVPGCVEVQPVIRSHHIPELLDVVHKMRLRIGLVGHNVKIVVQDKEFFKVIGLIRPVNDV